MFKTKLSRNDPCWCGSGRKYKNCHLNEDRKSRVLTRRGPRQYLRHPTSPKIIIKTPEQIEGIRAASQLVKQTLDMLGNEVKAGVTTNYLDKLAYQFTMDHGGFPAVLNYKGYPKSICTSVNNVICHGIPDDEELQDGDIVNVDITNELKGFFGDASRMYLIGDVAPKARKLVDVTLECLNIGIGLVKPMNTVGDIGFAIQRHAESHGYSVVRDYAGHGVGLRIHEEPSVNHFGKKRSGALLVPNMVFTIEPMINEGRHHSKVLDDDWTAVTRDGSLSAQWEHTVRVTDDGVEILTA